MLNTIALMGRFTHDLEIKELESGKKVISFCLAVNRDRATKNEEKKSDFVDCVAWENTAEFICTYFKKGDPIIIQGRLETRQYEDKQRNKRKAVYVLVNNVNFCAFKKDENSQDKEQVQESKENNTDYLSSDEDLPF